MEYLKHELEKVTGSLVEIQLLFDFIHEITRQSSQRSSQIQPSRKYALCQFEDKWKEILPQRFGNSFICFLEGCWLPKLSSDIQIQKQIPWKVFLKRYSDKISPCSTSLNFTPFNFDDLTQLKFWENLYEYYGLDMVRFIFEKCIVLLPIEDSFYLTISHTNSLFHKKIFDFSEMGSSGFKKIGNFGRRWSNYKTAVARIQEPLGLTNKLNGNPYDVPPLPAKHPNPTSLRQRRLSKRRARNKSKLCKKKKKERKRKQKYCEVISNKENCNPLRNRYELGNEETGPPSKKVKISSDLVHISNGKEGTHALPAASETDLKTVQENMIKLPQSRWITPSESTLQLIIKSRDSMKPNSVAPVGIGPSEIVISKPSPPYTFVNIMKDKYFKGKIQLITKEVHRVIPAEPLPKKLIGLKLPKEIQGSEKSIEITIHRISETAAKKFKLRINPRKRHRKQKKKQPANAAQATNEISNTEVHNSLSVTLIETRPEVTNGKRANIDHEEDLEEPTSKRVKLSDEEMKTNSVPVLNATVADDVSGDVQNAPWTAFDPTRTLETSFLLHHVSPGNKWPINSDIGKALNGKDSATSVNMLLEQILGFPVLLNEDETKCSAEALKAGEELKVLKTILNQIILFHRRAKDITKLTKNCVSFWIGKLDIKQKEREARKQEREMNRVKKLKKVKHRAELIDLTADTPSTNLSGSNPANSQPLMNSISAITVNSTGAEGRNNLTASHVDQQRPSFNSLLSTTPARSQSQRERQKLVFAKLKESITTSCILSAISQILFLSGAQQILGSNSNRKGFLTFIRKSIFLGGIKSAVHLGQLMSLLDATKCPWLNGVNDKSMKNHLLAKAVSWLFMEYILILLKTSFYVTELCNSRGQLSFYLRDSWRSVSERVKDQFIRKGTLSKLTEKSGTTNGTNGRLRLIPKKNLHVRTVLSLSKSINEKLHVSHCKLLLNYISGILAPHGTCDSSSFRKKWKDFLEVWKRNKCPTLYYIRLDIRDAYPSVNMQRLKDILLEAASFEEDLIVKKFVAVGRRGPPKLTLVNLSNPGRNWHTSIFSRPCLLKDIEQDSPFNKNDILKCLLNALESNIIRIGKHKYTFSHGLPQGWSLSQALCNIYYGHMDQKNFPEFLNDSSEFFVRSVDDYFFVSSNPSRIARFFHRMKCGVPEYNCNVNPDKSMTNIFVATNIPTSLDENEWVKFCGWRFCLASGHIARDFSSYAGQDFCSTLSFLLNKSTCAEQFIYRRMGFITPARLEYLILDPAINCRDRILMTIYEAGLVFAFRLYAACRALLRSINSVGDPIRGDYIFRSIIWCVISMTRFICRNNIHFYTSENVGRHECCLKTKRSSCSNWLAVPQSTPTSNSRKSKESMNSKLSGLPKCGDSISELEISFVIYQAFYKKLSIHSSAFNYLVLPKLTKKIRRLKSRLVNLSHYYYLMNIIGKSMPSHFLDIKI